VIYGSKTFVEISGSNETIIKKFKKHLHENVFVSIIGFNESLFEKE